MNRSYDELRTIQTFRERFEYLKLHGRVGMDTFGADRYLNQILYRSSEWRRLRDYIIVRDNACDLGMDGYPIKGSILIHHINPITKDDVLNRNPIIFDQNNLICVSMMTHNAIHYGDESLLYSEIVERKPNDTTPWKQKGQ